LLLRDAAERSGTSALGRVAAGCARAVLALAVIASAVVTPSIAQTPLVATVREKAVIPVGLARKKLAAPRLVVEVRKFEPASDDVVEVLVELRRREPKDGAADPVILGRFSIFPNAKFVAPTLADTQRFQLILSPANVRLVMEAGAVSVRLQAQKGGAQTASIELGAITLELPETEGPAPPKGG
jgi:hypothetical protein